MALLLAAAAPGLAPAAPLKLHVPSPDWRDQVIYFVVTDRFADGDASNNDQGAGEYKAGDGTRYNGGDLEGLRRKLPYIRGLGATALWVTPPVAQQWLDPSGSYAGYHGYWARHFKQVDEHLGTLADYRRLSDALHRAGMYLVHDIVVNHTGNYFGYGADWSAADPARGYLAYTTTPPSARPTQWPFALNDPRDPAQRRAAIYHWTPDVSDYTQQEQERRWQMGGLDDLNTENPVVRRALRDSHAWWIRQAGVDAFRVDTAFYVAPEYFEDFLYAHDPRAPGIATVARRTGRRAFFSFGEGFGIDPPGSTERARKIESYMTGERGQQRLPGMLNFPLYAALGDAFARGRPPAELAQRITETMTLHARPHLMPTFVDNHDVDRFLAGGSEAALKQALLAIFTLPGIPVVYYGTEQGFTEPRAAMFAAGFGSGGKDHYDTAAPLYRAIAEMAALRRGQRLFSRGQPKVLAANAARPGALAWRTDHGAQHALVAFNSAEGEALLANLDTGLPEGTRLQGLFGLQGRPADLVVGAQGRLSLKLPARAGLVWKAVPGRAAALAAPSAPSLDAAGGSVARHEGDFTVGGRSTPGQRLRVVVDGDLAAAQDAAVDASGLWQARVDTAAMADAQTEHSVVAWAEGQGASPALRFQVARPWRELADQADPAGDDRGPSGSYTYPSDPGWGEHRQADLRRVRVAEAGGALRLQLTLNEVTAPWNPPLGFDHVAFTVYIELPGAEGGTAVMPLQNASLPAGMRWHRRLRVGGWANALHRWEGASATSEGTPVTPAAAVQVDRATHTVTLTVPAAALGSPATLAGARIYVSTWDYDGGYRPLAPQAAPFAFGGGPADGARVMDDALVLLPR